MSGNRRVMTHEEAFVVLDAVALDALDGAERDAVLAHAEGCEICKRELSQLRDTAAFLAFSSPLGADTATKSRSRIHSRLMARASAAGDEFPKTAIDHPRPSNTTRPLAWRRAEWIAAAASVLLVVSTAMLFLYARDREDLRVAVMHRDSVIAGLTGKDVAMMTLTSTGAKAPFAHMFWDRSTNMWTLVAHNMPDLKAGRTYQLWLVTEKAKISAGTFEPKNGEAMVRAMYSLAPNELMALAVTEEPAGGMPQPTGSMVMAVQTQ